MSQRGGVSQRTRVNWLIDAAVFGGAVVAGITSIYFLVWPTGRSSQGLALLFARDTWGEFHTWGGVLMILAVAGHFVFHWSWVKSTTRRVFNAMRGGKGKFSPGARLNIAVDVVIALSFLLAALSGIYFLFAPAGGYQGGRNVGWDPGFLFSRTTWDLVHTWAGTALMMAALAHFYLHWGWVRKVTAMVLRSPSPVATRPARELISPAASQSTLP